MPKSRLRKRLYGGAMTRFQLDRKNLSNIMSGDENIELIKSLKRPNIPQQPLGQIVNIYNPASILHSEQIKSAYAEQTGFGRRRRHRGKGPAYLDRYGEFLHAY